MHDPIGVSGVHAVPKTLHSHGFFTPLRISPHWHAFGSATRRPGTRKCASASKAAYAARSFRPLWGIDPRPLHSKYSRGSKTSRITSIAFGFPSRHTAREYWFSI